MDPLIIPYNIDFSRFRDVIYETEAIVAGSFALAGYLKQEGIEVGYEPGDIDIFINGGSWCPSCNRYHGIDNEKNITKLVSFIESFGYQDSKKFDNFGVVPQDSTYYASLNRILKVTSFINDYGKEIQVVVLNVDDTLEHIKSYFDLTCCVSWWDVHTNTFQTLKPHLTKNRKMIVMPDRPDDKTIGRIEKYKLRGFTVVEKPCPAKVIPDAKLDIEELDGIEANDIINLEDVKVKDYLMASDWNMILKIGDSFYAFNRKDLYDAMKNKNSSNKHYVDDLYETPLKQSISYKAVELILFSDYSIFELVSPQTVKYGYENHHIATVYTVNCYTVHNYTTQTLSKTIIPKRKIVNNPVLNAIQQSFDDIIASNINQIQPQSIAEFQSMFASLNLNQ